MIISHKWVKSFHTDEDMTLRESSAAVNNQHVTS